ncbi:GPI-anchored adhesin-like protein [Quillaja saponaria]|uniref:GPI-anchored adhesin-like protein n=1 Tax=Quillaja saponaria TaxID=32244 RepID=A0AAD7LBW0_QUISA|nr:GPI-anchored adhesin-like protein [Quillaja saponaria]KAJ7955254.1 GPI-anchored adhesin-like protein [Quillaja saponaria]
MRAYETPQKEYARSSENSNRRSKETSSKKCHKITKKNLNAAFTSVSEISKESMDFSTISEISDANHIEDVTETFLLAEASSQALLLHSDLTPSSKNMSIINKTHNPSVNKTGFYESEGPSIVSVEADIAVNYLRKACSEVLSSGNAAPQYKKVLDELVKIVIEEFYTLPQERDCSAEVFSMKTKVLFLCLFTWIIGVSVVFFFIAGVHTKFSGPLPT